MSIWHQLVDTDPPKFLFICQIHPRRSPATNSGLRAEMRVSNEGRARARTLTGSFQRVEKITGACIFSWALTHISPTFWKIGFTENHKIMGIYHAINSPHFIDHYSPTQQCRGSRWTSTQQPSSIREFNDPLRSCSLMQFNSIWLQPLESVMPL